MCGSYGGVLLDQQERGLKTKTPINTLLVQPKRDCFHPGISGLDRNSIKLNEKEQVTGQDMIKAMLTYIWPKVGKIFFYYITYF